MAKLMHMAVVTSLLGLGLGLLAAQAWAAIDWQ